MLLLAQQADDIAAAAAAAGAAAATGGITSSIATWAQVGATGIIGALLVWLVTRGFPTMLRELMEGQNKARQWHEQEVKEVRTEAREHRETFAKCVAQFNDTTMRLVEKSNGKTA